MPAGYLRDDLQSGTEHNSNGSAAERSQPGDDVLGFLDNCDIDDDGTCEFRNGVHQGWQLTLAHFVTIDSILINLDV
eukprot:m.70645 g.70645  ORF g.70645 m.70645 type:complete len:77 (+) comp18534_c0_seq1:119-349(+)